MARNNKLKNAYFKLLHKQIRKQKSRCSRLTYGSKQRSQKWQQEIEKASAFITNISIYALTDDQIITLSKVSGSFPLQANQARFHSYMTIIIIIIHRLRSRRPQGFSMHNDHQKLRQSAVLALLLHYPQAIFSTWSTRSPFANGWNVQSKMTITTSKEQLG